MEFQSDLWQNLRESKKAVVLYGMGNGADKIFKVCDEKGITVRDVFASDGFVRGQVFHGKRVLSWSEVKETYGAENVTVLLSFGTSRPEVLDTIRAVAAEAELYAPDVPAFGDALFDLPFYDRHREEIAEARALLSDEESRRIFDHVLQFKLTGEISHLFAAESDPDEVMRQLVRPETLTAYADLGAYTGDTVREMLGRSGGSLRDVYAFEPDARNYRKLETYANGEKRAAVHPVPVAAWSESAALTFDGSGNRNASLMENRSASLGETTRNAAGVIADTVDHVLSGRSVGFIKYDVEGAERQALAGSAETIKRDRPTLLVSVYHRSEDLFALPLFVRERFPEYRGFFLRRFAGIPAWDLNLYVRMSDQIF